MIPNIRIDGVTVEPSPADDPDAMGPTAVDIDCDLDALALKMHGEVKSQDVNPMFASKIRLCFTGKEAVDWCLGKAICSDELDAVRLLNRMLRRGLMHHHNLNKLMENSPMAYYRFPHDHFKILIDHGANKLVRHRLRPRAKTLHGEAALEERWYADVPNLPLNKVRNLGVVLQRLVVRDLHRGLRRHLKVFTGKEAVGVLVESGVAKDITDALAIGNAFLRAGLFHHVNLKYPLRNDDMLYRLAKCQYDLIMNRDHVAGMAYGSRTYAASAGMDESRVGIVSEPRSELKDGIDTQGQSALELATTSRYWTSYRASKLYVLNLYVLEGFIDMSDDWDSHVDQVYPTYCECYLTRDKDATAHYTVVSRKTLHPVWNYPITFVDVDYLDTISIHLKAHTQLGNDSSIGSLEFAAHEVMGASNEPIVVEFDCGTRQVAECAAAIITVQFDPAVAGGAEGPEGSKHHHILMNGARATADLPNLQYGSIKGGVSRLQTRRSMRGSIRRSSLRATAEEMDPVYISVAGPHCCVLLDDDSVSVPKRADSFTAIALGLMAGANGSSHRESMASSLRSSLHSLPGGWDPDRLGGAPGGGSTAIVKRASYTSTSSEARRGSQQSDLPDIDEDDEFHDTFLRRPSTANGGVGVGVGGGGGGGGGSINISATSDAIATLADSSSGNATGTIAPASSFSTTTTSSGEAGSNSARAASAGGVGSSAGKVLARMQHRTSCEPQLLRRGPGRTGSVNGGRAGLAWSGEKEVKPSNAGRRLTWGGTSTEGPVSTTTYNRQ